MIQSNERKIVESIIHDEYPHLSPHKDEIVAIIRRTLTIAASIIYRNGKVLFKNFGTFALMQRKMRPRYDTGLKATVETEPMPKMEFTQSPNVFRVAGDEVVKQVENKHAHNENKPKYKYKDEI